MTGNVICVVLAGGQGSRLRPLTDHRAKPAVPFGGKYRIIDFVLANLFNSGLRNILVMTQYAPLSLYEHVQQFWIPLTGFGESLTLVPPKMRTDIEAKYWGTADAVWQNWDVITNRRYCAEHIAIFGGDHIYTMDVSQVLTYHIEKRSAFTVCVDVVPVEVAAGELGVLEVDNEHRVLRFVEKPPLALVPHIPGKPGYCYASMGNYLADRATLGIYLSGDAINKQSKHDFGKDIIPAMHQDGLPIYAYPFNLNVIQGQTENYWRDVGTIPAYYAATMEMLGFVPKLNLYNPHWPIPTFPDNLPCGRFIGEQVHVSHVSTAGGVVVDDARVGWSTLGREVMVKKGAVVWNTNLFDGVVVGAGARLRNVIVDKDCHIPDGYAIGFDRREDDIRGYTTVDLAGDEWITVVPKGYEF